MDINELCGYLGPYFAEKINVFKRNEFDLRVECEYLNEKIYKLETAFANYNLNGNLNSKDSVENVKDSNKEQNNEFLRRNTNTKSDVFKNSAIKRISDPLTKILDIINKIMFLTSDSINNTKDEKYIFINKFKRKLFSKSSINNATVIKTEIMKLLNFSKETINFEVEEKEYANLTNFNSTGMKVDYFKTRITYDLLYHFIEELLIFNRYY